MTTASGDPVTVSSNRTGMFPGDPRIVAGSGGNNQSSNQRPFPCCHLKHSYSSDSIKAPYTELLTCEEYRSDNINITIQPGPDVGVRALGSFASKATRVEIRAVSGHGTVNVVSIPAAPLAGTPLAMISRASAPSEWKRAPHP